MSKTKSLTFLRMPQVIQKVGMSASSIYELIAAGEFPRQVPISEQRRAWIAEEVDEWMAQRIARRDQHAA